MSNWTEANWNTGQFTSVPTTAPTPPPSPSTGRGGGKGGFGGGGGGGHCQIQMGLKDSTGYSSYFVYTYATAGARLRTDQHSLRVRTTRSWVGGQPVPRDR